MTDPVSTPVADAAGWRDIATAPKDETTILAAVEVHNNKTGKSYWDYALMYFSEGRWEFLDGADTGWDGDDYTHWQPLPPPNAQRISRAEIYQDARNMTQTLSEIVEQTAAWPENKLVPVEYCIDCRFFRDWGTGLQHGRCAYSDKKTGARFISPDLDASDPDQYASLQRDNANLCGPDAKWFEAKASSSVAA